MPSEERSISFTLNGKPVTAPEGSSVAAALLANGVTRFRRSVSGSARAPLCGMGICYECRCTVDRVEQVRSCMVPLVEGAEVRTDE